MNTQAKEAKLIPFLEKDLLVKYHDDADYVAKVKQDCMVRGRVTVDPIVPTDTTKNRYWIAETSYSCVESLSSAIRLQSDLTVTNQQAIAMTAPGALLGGLSADGFGLSISAMDGFSNSFMGGGPAVPHAAAPLALEAASEPPKAKRQKKGAAAAQQPSGAPAPLALEASGGSTPNPPPPPTDTPLQLASKMLAKLAKKVGEAKQLVLHMANIKAHLTAPRVALTWGPD